MYIGITNKYRAYDVDSSEVLWTSDSDYLWNSSEELDWFVSDLPGYTYKQLNTSNSVQATFEATGIMYNSQPVYAANTSYLWFNGTSWIINGLVGGLTDETHEVTNTTFKIWNIRDGETETHDVTVDNRDELSWTLDNATHDTDYPQFTPDGGEEEGPFTPGTWTFNVTGTGGCCTDKAVLSLHVSEYTGDAWYSGGTTPIGEYSPRGSLRGAVEDDNEAEDAMFIAGFFSGYKRNDDTGSDAPWGKYNDLEVTSDILESDGTYSIDVTETWGSTDKYIGDPVWDETSDPEVDDPDSYTNKGMRSDIMACEIAQWLGVA
jgi:hypothetical protein